MAFETRVDWDALALDFAQGMSTKEMCEKYKISRVGLDKGLKKRGMVRTNATVIRDRARKRDEDALLQENVAPVNEARANMLGEIAGDVLIRHRHQIYQSQHVAAALKHQLMEAINKREEIEEAVIEYFGAQAHLNPTQISAIRQRMSNAMAALSLPVHMKALTNMAAAEKTYIELERKAYRLDDEGDGKGTYEDYLKEMHEKIIARQKEQKQLALQSEAVASQN